MINDKNLGDFLRKPNVATTQNMTLVIGDNGENLLDWQMQFNRLNIAEMYLHYQNVVNQLMHAQMEEYKRLELFVSVLKVAERLISSLHQIYKNQSGILNESQQQALDMAISVQYLGVIFYNSVWQRVANNPQLAEKKGISVLFGRSKTADEIVKQCLYGMMSLLRQALFEKQIGYRKNTEVIWQWLNACYHFMQSNNWKNVAYHLPLFGQTGLTNGKPLTMEEVYHQCLFSEVVNPLACRRPDILMWQKMSNDWHSALIITSELAEKPYLFINQKSNQPPQLLHAELAFNPFSKDSNCLFIGFSKLTTILQQVVAKSQNSQDANDKILQRFANLMLQNINKRLMTPEKLGDATGKCQAVVGFYHIHYMLANKTSLGNLIQANELPERLRPRSQVQNQLNKSTLVDLVESNFHQYHLSNVLAYIQTSDVQHTLHRGSEITALSQLQVGSMVATRLADDPNKTWFLGRIETLQQTPKISQVFAEGRKKILDIDVMVRLFGRGVIPCGVRLQNPGNRPHNFVPALVIPKNAEFNRHVTTVMMARFGYQTDEKLIMRIDNKDANIRLVELLNITDDVEEYSFIRVQ
ncbi:hypothetical protein MOMA_04440 [Moraxella macacae 0408225]|uniref:Uncharacterized protein n=1 Tax=Moraxella macacae 0408225 TaxID=1230338 RepID=L2F993_9GAMM|nr:hypothetical protein [Moraxella macacae]ELA09624.1 hypothetical protein MOMA_04440 [Moraxella macacae 0408225]